MDKLTRQILSAVLVIAIMTSLTGCGNLNPGQGAGKGDTAETAVSSVDEELYEDAEEESEGGQEIITDEDEEILPGDDEEWFPDDEEDTWDDEDPEQKPGGGLKGVDYASWVDSDVQQYVQMLGDKEVKLEDDFHLYVNRDWILNTRLPDGYSSYDPITARAMEVDEQVSAILKNPEKETDPDLVHAQDLVQKYYKMWMDWDQRNELGVQHLKELLDPLMKVETLDDLTAYLSMPRTATSATELLICDASMDWNNADYYAVYVMPIELIFGDSMYYGMMDEDDAMAEPYYDVVIRHILVEMGYSNEEATSILKGCFAFEKDISEYIMTTEEQSARDAIEKENNPRTLQQLEAEAGDFPIREILAAYRADGSDMYILTEPDWLSAMDVLYDESNVENLKDYLICYTAQDYATLLDRECYDKYYEVINGISGATGTRSDEKGAADAVNQFFPSQLGRLYADKYVTDETKNEVTGITREIMAEYRVMLAEEEFLSEATRAEAIRKLDNMQLQIAKPEKWEDDSQLNIRGGDEGGNLISAQDEAGAFWVEVMNSKINQKVDRSYWTTKIQQVNAFYDPSQNRITLCGGILGGDLYNVNMSKEELYANVGDTIAHEISHAFDTTGSQFDEKGNIRNWWTQEDKAAFSARADKLSAYYDGIEPFEDTYCVGSQIEGEAIADLVAVKILLRLAKKDADFDYDKFFKSFSESWRTITTMRSEYYTLLQDTHPLAYLRVNAVVQQFQEFYDTYGIKKGDGMYLAPEKRLEVW